MHKLTFSMILVGCVLVMMGCGDDDGAPSHDASQDAGSADGALLDSAVDAAPPDAAPPPPFELTSSAFSEGEVIPLRYECGGAVISGPGENISPDLTWTEGPAGTLSYAIIMDDVDSGVVHWVIYDIPPSILMLPEDMPSGYTPSVLPGAKQAEIQGSGYYGYFGPCSEFSTNTYRWTIHAMSTATVTGATQTTTEYQMVPLIQAESLESATLSGES